MRGKNGQTYVFDFSKKIYVTTMLAIFKFGVKKAIPIIVIRMA